MNRNISIDDFLKNTILTNLRTHSSGKIGAYFANTPDMEKNNYEKSLWVFQIETRKVEKLDLPFVPDDFQFGEEGIILKSITGEKTRFHSCDYSGDSVKELATLPFRVKDFRICRDCLYFTAPVDGPDPDAPIRCSVKAPFFTEGRGVTGNEITVLFHSSLNTPDITMLSPPDISIDQIDFDPDLNRIVFSAFAAAVRKPVASSLYLYDMGSESVRLLHDENFRIGRVASLNDEKVLFFGVDLNKKNRNDNQRIYTINTLSLERETLGVFRDRSNEDPAVVTDSFFSEGPSPQRYDGNLYFKQVEEDREILCSLSPDGDFRIYETGMKAIGGFAIIPDGMILMGLEGLKLSEIYLFSRNRLEKITNHNRWLEEVNLSIPEKITVVHGDTEIRGYVYPPAVLPEKEKAPGVLLIHGGPKMIYTDVYSHEIQMLCSRGFYVFCANPMGSDGRGDDFADIRGRFGELPFKQLMAFTDGVLDQFPLIDRDNLGVSGGSYGGYMTNYIITATDRFGAAVSERGISSLVSSFTSSDIGFQFVGEYLGKGKTPWTVQKEAIESSPFFRADRVKTPTLFIHGEKDYRCHYTESLNMYGALIFNGIEARMCLFGDESHSLTVRGRPRSKQKRYREMLDWFDKYLKKELMAK